MEKNNVKDWIEVNNPHVIKELSTTWEKGAQAMGEAIAPLLKKYQNALKEIVKESQILKTNPNCLYILRIAENALKENF